MFEELSKQIRMKKKKSLRPDWDVAGQEAVDPNAAWDAKQNAEVNNVLGDPDHEPASASMMGEGESSQDESARKRISKRIDAYFNKMMIEG